jgi:glutamate/aspartate transport system substrate-binding protein
MRDTRPGRARLLSALAALCCATALQAATLDDIRERGSIRLGYSETKAPFSFKARDDGQPAGYSVDLCKCVAAAVARSLAPPALKVEWVPLVPSTRVEAVLMQRVDIECGTTTATLSRRRQVDFSLPIYADTSSLLARAAVARALPALAGRRIAVAESTTNEQVLARALATRGMKAEVVRTRTLAQSFELLKAGQVDALVGDRTAIVGTFLLQGQAEGLVLLDEALSYEPYALALRRGDAAFRLLVDSVLADLYRSGEIETIVRTWLSPLGTLSPAVRALFELNALPE